MSHRKKRTHESDEEDNREIANFNPRPTGRRRHSRDDSRVHVPQPRPATPHFGRGMLHIPDHVRRPQIQTHGFSIRNPSGPVPRDVYDELEEKKQRLEDAYNLLRREHAEYLARCQGESTVRVRGIQVQANAQLLAQNQRMMSERSQVVKLNNLVSTQRETIHNQNLKIERLENELALEQDIKAGKYTDNGDVVEGHFRAELNAYKRAVFALKQENKKLKRENNALKSVVVMEDFGDMNLGGGGNRKGGGGNRKGGASGNRKGVGGSSRYIYNKLKLTF